MSGKGPKKHHQKGNFKKGKPRKKSENEFSHYTPLVAELFSIASEFNTQERIQNANCFIEKHKEKLIGDFDSFMAATEFYFLENQIDYQKLIEINTEIHKECLGNPNAAPNKNKWEDSEALIFKGFITTNFWHIVLTLLVPELSPKNSAQIEELKKSLIFKISEDLFGATHCLIEKFVRNELASDYYACYRALREKCDWILEIAPMTQTNLFNLFNLLDTKAPSNTANRILSGMLSLMSGYKYAILYLSFFSEDYSKLLDEALVLCKTLDNRDKQINKLKSSPVLEKIKEKINQLKLQFRILAEQQKEDREKIKSPCITLFNDIYHFYLHKWTSSALSQELDLNSLEEMNALISNMETTNAETKFKIITKLINLLPPMPTGNDCDFEKIKISELLNRVLPYIDFSSNPNEKCVVFTIQAIFKRMAEDIQDQNLESMLIELPQTTQPLALQAIEPKKDTLITDFSSLNLNETSKYQLTKLLKKEETEFKQREEKINQEYALIAQSCEEVFKKEIESYRNELLKQEEQLIQRNQEEIKALQSKFTASIVTSKEEKEAEFKKREKQIIQDHQQEMKACKEGFKKEREDDEREYEAWDRKINELQEKNKKALKALKNKNKLLRKATTEEKEAHKQNVESTIKKAEEKLRQETKKFEQDKQKLINLKNQNEQQIASIKETYEHQLTELKQKQGLILKEITEIQQKHPNECTELKNTYDENISALKHSIAQECNPYKAIIGLTPIAEISVPKEIDFVLQELENHKIEYYIFGGYVRGKLLAQLHLIPQHLIHLDDIDVKVNCTFNQLPPKIRSFATIGRTDTVRVGRLDLVCTPWEDLKLELLLNIDFKINALICRNNQVYDLLGVYNHISHPYLETMQPPLETFKKNPAIILRLIRLAFKLNKSILPEDYLTIHEYGHLILQLPLGIYLINIQKLFTNCTASEYYLYIKNAALLDIVFPMLPGNYKDYLRSDGLFATLELFWLQKMNEFANYPDDFDGDDVLALFLLMPLLQNMMAPQNRGLSLEAHLQKVMYDDFLGLFVGSDAVDQNRIYRSICALILGNNEAPGLYQQYHDFENSVLTLSQSSYTPAFKSQTSALNAKENRVYSSLRYQ